jgi:hypothetical protein
MPLYGFRSLAHLALQLREIPARIRERLVVYNMPMKYVELIPARGILNTENIGYIVSTISDNQRVAFSGSSKVTEVTVGTEFTFKCMLW